MTIPGKTLSICLFGGCSHQEFCPPFCILYVQSRSRLSAVLFILGQKLDTTFWDQRDTIAWLTNSLARPASLFLIPFTLETEDSFGFEPCKPR
jgi:hypothetical protein